MHVAGDIVLDGSAGILLATRAVVRLASLAEDGLDGPRAPKDR